MFGAAQSSLKHPEQKLLYTVWAHPATYDWAEWVSTLKEMSLWYLHRLEPALLKETRVNSNKNLEIETFQIPTGSHWQITELFFLKVKFRIRHATRLALKVSGNISWNWTFCPPAPCSNNPSKETLSLLSQTMLVHTLCNTDSTHCTVLPATLTHQDLLHCVFIQHHLHRRNTFYIFMLDRICLANFCAVKWIICMGWCFWVLTSGMELICFFERENTSLPKCSTSPTCHLDGSLAKKDTCFLITPVLCNPCLQAQCYHNPAKHYYVF